MKTLQHVEPRTPISSLPFRVTNSGSYYLTGNLTNTGVSGYGIRISIWAEEGHETKTESRPCLKQQG